MTGPMTSHEVLAKLVAFETVSDRSNLDLIDWVEGYLAELGVTSTRVADADQPKASLYAHIGPDTPGGVILSGHTDVVPVEGQDWTTDPWTLTERDGRLYGRGTCDMKGFLATALAAVPAMQAANLARPIQLALSYDEEIGCFAAPQLAAEMHAKLPRARLAIIGEPTELRVVNQHKAITDFVTHVRGHEVHSSLLPYGVSAVMVAGRLLGWMEARNAENRAAARGDSPYDPPWTTLHAGVIHGGTAHNITARDCHFTTDIRCLPDEDIHDWIARYRAFCAQVEAETTAIHPDCSIRVEINSVVPGCRAEPDGAAEALVRRLTGDNATNVVSYATEAGQFQDAGFSAVICGPGSIVQAHQADEYLSLDQLARGDAFIAKLIDDLRA